MAAHRELFADERGAGLRASWHPERELVVLSIWKGDVCVGTFHLPIADAGRLSATLSSYLAEFARDGITWTRRGWRDVLTGSDAPGS